MANTFYLQVLASDHVFYKGRVETLVIPAPDGEELRVENGPPGIEAGTGGEETARAGEEKPAPK